MNSTQRVVVICLLSAGLSISGCEPGQLLGPTVTFTPLPTATPTNTPTLTPLPTITPVPTETATPTPITTWLIDPKNDAELAHVDVEGLGYEISGETLRVTLLIRDVPSELNFNRVGVPKDRMEYGWIVYVDVDSNPATGSSGGPVRAGADYAIGATYFVWDTGTIVTDAITDVVQTDVTKLDGLGFSRVTEAVLQVNSEAETMVLIGEIPGLVSTSRVFFYTYDYNPGGRPISDS
jgi:hypothetical protein